MPTLIACPICHHDYNVADTLIGKTSMCPSCGVRHRAKIREEVKVQAPVVAAFQGAVLEDTEPAILEVDDGPPMLELDDGPPELEVDEEPAVLEAEEEEEEEEEPIVVIQFDREPPPREVAPEPVVAQLEQTTHVQESAALQVEQAPPEQAIPADEAPPPPANVEMTPAAAEAPTEFADPVIATSPAPVASFVKVDDYGSQPCEAKDLQEFEAILQKRYENSANAFWLTNGDEEYPTLGMFVKGDIAYLYFVPGEGEAGFCSQGLFGDMLPGEKTTFLMSQDGEEMQVLNEFVVSWSEALTAAKEFFATRSLPQSIEWFALGASS